MRALSPRRLSGLIALLGFAASSAASAQTSKTVALTGSVASVCGIGTTTFNLTFDVAKDNISNLRFDQSPAGSVNTAGGTATTSKNYIFKCNSTTRSFTINANAAIAAGKTQNYIVRVVTGSTNVSASTNGSSGGTNSFTPGAADLNAGVTYTITVTTVAPSNGGNAGSYSTTFTIQ